MHYQIPMYDSDMNPGAIDIQCQITGSGGPCTLASINSEGSSVQTITSYENFASSMGDQVVTITDGPLPAASGATGTIPSTSATSTTGSAAGETGFSDSSAGSSTTASRSASSSSGSSTKASTGGVPVITSHPQWVIGGVVAAAAAVAAM
jgi:hypothetical protein